MSSNPKLSLQGPFICLTLTKGEMCASLVTGIYGKHVRMLVTWIYWMHVHMLVTGIYCKHVMLVYLDDRKLL